MKKSPMPRRRSSLRPGGPLPRYTPLRRKTKLKSSGPIKVSRPKVPPEERDAKKAVKKRSGGLCEACGNAEAIHWHHRINQGQGGAWSAANGMHVCLFCHDWIGDFPVSAGVLGWHLEPWRDRDGKLTSDPAKEPLRYRGQWVVLGDDGAVTPTQIPERAAVALRAAQIGATA